MSGGQPSQGLRWRSASRGPGLALGLALFGTLLASTAGPVAAGQVAEKGVAVVSVLVEGKLDRPLQLELGGADLLVRRTPPGGGSRLVGTAADWQVERKSQEGGEFWEITAKKADAASALVLEVPADLPLTIRGTTGAVEIEGALLAPLTVANTTGEVTLWVAKEARLAVKAATSGDLVVDFSVVVDYDPHREPSKTAQLSVQPWGEPASTQAASAQPVSLESRQGTLRILRFESRSSSSQSH